MCRDRSRHTGACSVKLAFQTGGWGGSTRTLGIVMDGFSEEEIAKAVDHCDNDKIRGKFINLSVAGAHEEISCMSP